MQRFRVVYLTIIQQGCVGYELAITISYPTSTSGIIVLLKTFIKNFILFYFILFYFIKTLKKTF
jgi:hypothetical protein